MAARLWMLCFHVGKCICFGWLPLPLPPLRVGVTPPSRGGNNPGVFVGVTVAVERVTGRVSGVGRSVVVARCTLGSNGAS